MASADEGRKGLSIGAIVAGAIFALVAIVSAFLIFHPGGALTGAGRQLADERARAPVTSDAAQEAAPSPQKIQSSK